MILMTPEKIKEIERALENQVPSTGINPPHSFNAVDEANGSPALDQNTKTILIRHVFYDDQGRRCTRWLGPLDWKRKE